QFDPEVQELREATVTRPLARYPVAYEHEPSFGILLPHLAKLKALCQLIQIRATAKLELKQVESAFDELKVAFRISDSIHDEPILISHLVRISTVVINVQTVCEGLVRHAWSEPQLVELEKQLASIDLLADYKIAMRGERAFNVSAIDWVRRNPSAARKSFD